MPSTNDTSNSSDNTQTTPTTTATSLSPTWGPPKAPLDIHRLAKLANALGVATPIPVHHRKSRVERSPSPYLISSPGSSGNSLNTAEAFASIRDAYSLIRRSPTPSSSGSVLNSSTPYTYTSKFLLHVVPPLYLPHDSQLVDNVASGSGYHPEFRRGTLVPVHPTLNAQLWAIAKEYALPSTNGLVLYLVTSAPSLEGVDGEEEPGPRLSEEIWKHLWTRVWKIEREELPPVMPPLGVPGPVSESPSVPNFGQNLSSFSQSQRSISPLRPFISTARNNSSDVILGSYPSPSTPSSTSVNTFTQSLRSRSPTSELQDTTPPTSHSNSFDSTDSDPNLLRANSLQLPGLNSPSLMPILAKVEFGIDRKKATWFEPWAKRRRVKKGNKEKSAASTDDPRKPLKLPKRVQANATSLFLPDGQPESEAQEMSDEESEEEEEEDIGDENETARVLSTSGPDLMGIERSNSLARKRIPPPLVLHPAGGTGSKEVKIASPVPSPHPMTGNGSLSSTSLPYLKGVSPDDGILGGMRYEADPDASGSDAGGTAEEEPSFARLRNPHDSEKRIGGVYDDFDLEFDDNDPHDRRKSQVILKAKLDELERNLAQLSPRALKLYDFEEQQSPSIRSVGLSSPRSPYLGVPSPQGPSVLMNSDVLPPTPRKGTTDSDANPSSPTVQWPSIPFSSLNESLAGSRKSRTESVSNPTPRLAINGVSTIDPNAFSRNSSSSGGSVSAETRIRRKEAEDDLFYPGLNVRSSISGSDDSSPVIPLSPDPFGRFSSSDQSEVARQRAQVWDAVPFGGSVDQLIENSKKRQSLVMSIKDSPARTSEGSSRFSTDSTKDNIEIPGSIAKSLSDSATSGSVKDKSNRSTVMSMKGIKKLWRKSNKNSVSSNGPPTPIPESTTLSPGLRAEFGNASPVPSHASSRAPSPQSLQNLPQPSAAPTRPARPLKEDLTIPDIPDQLAIPLHPDSGRPAPMPIIAAQMQAGLQSRPIPSGDRMAFDQETPYPSLVKKAPQRKMSMGTTNASLSSSSRASSPAHSVGGSIGSAAGVATMSENRNASVRKSILKWKAAAAVHQNGEQSDSNSIPVRRSRGLSIGSGSRPSSFVNSDIPPSPKVPDHFLTSRAPSEHSRAGLHLTTYSTDSRLTSATDISSFQSLDSPSSSQTSHGDLARNPSLDSNTKQSLDSIDPRKMSFDSYRSDARDDDDDSRPSIDSSHFEMVSPKMKGGALIYPYTTVGMQS